MKTPELEILRLADMVDAPHWKLCEPMLGSWKGSQGRVVLPRVGRGGPSGFWRQHPTAGVVLNDPGTLGALEQLVCAAWDDPTAHLVWTLRKGWRVRVHGWCDGPAKDIEYATDTAVETPVAYTKTKGAAWVLALRNAPAPKTGGAP